MRWSLIKDTVGYYRAAKTYGVPQITRKVKKVRENSDENASGAIEMKVRLGPQPSVFPFNKKKELCNYILYIAIIYYLYGLTTKDLRGLVYRVAIKTNISHLFNDEKNLEGLCSKFL